MSNNNEMEFLKNAVKALEKKYSGNGFIAVDNEGALMDALRLANSLARRENKAYFLVIPVDKTVHSEKDAANVFFLADSKSKMIVYMLDRRKDIDAMFEVNGGQVTDLLWKKSVTVVTEKSVTVVTERPTVDKFKENSWDKIVALKKEGEEKRNQILAVGKKQIESILKEGEIDYLKLLREESSYQCKQNT